MLKNFWQIETYQDYFVYIILGFVLFLLINYFGSKSKGLGYVNLSDIIGQHNSFGFNFFFRILTPSIFISIFSIIFYLTNNGNLVSKIYLVPIFYFLIQSLYILLRGYWVLVNKKLYIITHLSSFLVAYGFYKLSLIRGLDYILPDSGNFRTEIWFIVVLYFYKILNDYQPVNDMNSLRSTAITQKFRRFENRYKDLLIDEFLNNKILYKIFFSIMIVEDLNRNKVLRKLEKILFPLGIVKTTGIMQVESNRYLSDEESIEYAQNLILNIIEKNRDRIEYPDELIMVVASEYNGRKYYDQINEIYHEISYLVDDK